MIKLLLKNHSIKYDLEELIKVFFPGREIIIIDDESQYSGRGVLIISQLIEENNELIALTQFYIDNTLADEYREDIRRIEVYDKSPNKDVKIGIKKSLYNLLISKSQLEIPWGILTGIRPVKIVHDLLDKNIHEQEIINVLTNEYKLDMQKTMLILDIAKRQRQYIYPLDDNRFSLYIGIPFCPTRCLYCSFPALPVGRYGGYIDEYTSKVIYEIDKISNLMKGKKIHTVYIGGGTPTAIPIKSLERIINAIYSKFNHSDIEEFTVEAGRPDTITKEYLTMLNENLIKRISINPQTMNDKTLHLIGRNHQSEDIVRTFYLAKEIGFDVINMDLIVGLPGEDVDDINSTLKKIEVLNPENLTVHTLSVKRGSKFKETIKQFSIQSQSTIASMLESTNHYSKNMDMIPYYLYRQKQILGNYENIGYSKPGMECIYNILMMEEKQTIIAAGMGSVSKIFFSKENRIERIPNFKDLREYFNRIDELILKKEKLLKGE